MVWTICIEDTIKHTGSTSTSVPGGRRWVAEDQQDNVSRSPNTNGNGGVLRVWLRRIVRQRGKKIKKKKTDMGE